MLDNPLDPVAVRVLGSLIEKERTTPDNYPLTLNALVAACNQTTNREPVLHLDEAAVVKALDDLRRRSLVHEVFRSDSRARRYRHVLSEKLSLHDAETALLCVLMLRGPQTTGELRGRTERLYTFDDLEAVESTLHRLAEIGFTKQLPRQPGTKEPRWAHLMCGDVEAAEAAAPAPAERGPADRERIARLETDLAQLRQEFDDFRRRFE